MDDRPDSAPGDIDLEPVLDDIERWFVLRGLPHFAERKTDGSILDAWTRAIPLLVVASLLLGFNALDLRNWTVGQNLAAATAILDGPAYLLVFFTFFALGAAFALSRVPGTIRGVNDVAR